MRTLDDYEGDPYVQQIKNMVNVSEEYEAFYRRRKANATAERLLRIINRTNGTVINHQSNSSYHNQLVGFMNGEFVSDPNVKSSLNISIFGD